MPVPNLASFVGPLETGPLHRFGDWPNSDVPTVAAGVYTVWDGDTLIYVGMAGRSLTAEALVEHRGDPSKKTGLRDRLNSHASGRRSGDQFCLYVSDLLVLPRLTTAQIQAIADRRLKLDDLTREYVRGRLAYRVIETPDGATAREVEREVQRGALSAGRPLLNPLD